MNNQQRRSLLLGILERQKTADAKAGVAITWDEYDWGFTLYADGQIDSTIRYEELARAEAQADSMWGTSPN